MNLVKAFKRLEDSSKILVLCGSGDQLEEIKQQASSCKNIFVAPNIPREGVSAIYNLSDYGLLPHPPDIDFQLAPPTKLSEMLSHNLKIICSENTYVHKNLKDKMAQQDKRMAGVVLAALAGGAGTNEIIEYLQGPTIEEMEYYR